MLFRSLVSLRTIALPGVYSVIVPLASVVVVVVVVSCETCPHANGATHAKAILRRTFFMIFPFLFMAIKLPLPVNFGPGGRAYRHIVFGFGPHAGRLEICARCRAGASPANLGNRCGCPTRYKGGELRMTRISRIGERG